MQFRSSNEKCLSADSHSANTRSIILGPNSALVYNDHETLQSNSEFAESDVLRELLFARMSASQLVEQNLLETVVARAYPHAHSSRRGGYFVKSRILQAMWFSPQNSCIGPWLLGIMKHVITSFVRVIRAHNEETAKRILNCDGVPNSLVM